AGEPAADREAPGGGRASGRRAPRGGTRAGTVRRALGGAHRRPGGDEPRGGRGGGRGGGGPCHIQRLEEDRVRRRRREPRNEAREGRAARRRGDRRGGVPSPARGPSGPLDSPVCRSRSTSSTSRGSR